MTALKITNDLKRINRADTLYKAHINSELSVIYIILLIGSVAICTLGLLLGYAPVVIGGMLISPLMWPLMRLAIGIASERKYYIKSALFLLLISTTISILISAVITYFSPIKFLNEEIIARTNPTLLDIIVALSAGGIAAIAIAQPRVSESVAGVAIATSLLPPLCVGGIGLALSNESVLTRGFLLFLASAVSIIFVSTIVFIFLKIKPNTTGKVQKKGLLYTLFLLLITAIPLFIFLRQYSFETLAYNNVQKTLKKSVEEISPVIHIDNFKVSVPSNKSLPVLVEADILISEDTKMDYTQRQTIKTDLEEAIGRPVDVRLRIQRTISIITEKDQQQVENIELIKDVFLEEIKNIEESLTPSSLEVSYEEKTNLWNLKSVLRANPDILFTISQKNAIKTKIMERTGFEVNLDLEIIPRILLKTEDNEETTESQKNP